ncbi:MAG: phosphonate C-P lyase system protein PhnH [Aestuariivirga sp.]|uniref:phosphonate C-P lyase system protein PhnH n=1 Tax=Aestuariivirga sp. TaxID=2650926 RepID=UPI0038D257CA
MTEAGFAEPAADAAHAFRAIMKAMARPGVVTGVPSALTPPAPLLPAAAAIALTLCDFQTPVWFSPRLANAELAQYLRFHTGAPLVTDVSRALFLFLTADDDTPALEDLAQGTHEYPDRSASLVIQVPGFHTGAIEIAGPGIPSPAGFGVAGIGSPFWQALERNHARFPLGVDVFFATSSSIAALPRSTAIRLKEAA